MSIPSVARVEVDNDSGVDDLSDVDGLFRRRRAGVVAEIAVLLDPAERLSTGRVVLADDQVAEVALTVGQRDLAVCSTDIKQCSDTDADHRPARK